MSTFIDRLVRIHGRRRLRAGAITTFVATAHLVLATAALAAPAATYRSVTLDVPAGQQVTATATCAAGESLVGGGFTNGMSARDLNITRADVATNKYGAASYQVTANNYSPLARPITSTAICVTELVAHYRSATITVPAGQQVSAHATCAAGESLVGGGFTNAMSARALDVTRASASIDKYGETSFIVTANNYSKLERPVSATAVCVAGQSATIRSTTASVPAGQQVSAVATCASSESLLGGGFTNIMSDRKLNITNANASTDKYGAASYSVTANNYSGLTRTVTAAAICLA